jgi:hypothetical protein
VVDEGHPYFFDHPLDHVSGILMVEGMLQSVEAADVTRDTYLRHLRLTFPRFCEKDAPITLEVTQASEGGRRSCRALQAGVPVCTLKFHADRAPAPARAAPQERARATPANAKALHKSNAANVLIEAWRVRDGVAECSLLAPPAGHQLAEGDPNYYSPVYVLETSRQLVTGLAHTEYGVPQGMPMNLVGVDIALEAPLPRAAQITLRHKLKPIPAAGSNTFAHFELELVVGGQVLGNCRLTAQLLTKEAYLRVRNRTSPAAAA